MTGKPIITVVAAALMDTSHRVLLAQRPEGKHMAGTWEFPGGKVDPGETPEESLCRELREELGIILEPSRLKPLAFASHPYGDFHLLLLLYECRSWRGIPTGHEGQNIDWFKADALDVLPMPPADVPLLPLIKSALAS